MGFAEEREGRIVIIVDRECISPMGQSENFWPQDYVLVCQDGEWMFQFGSNHY